MSEVHTPSIAKDTCRLLTAGVGALVAGIAAWRALNTWRAQQKGEARFDSAKRLPIAAHDPAQAFYAARNPVILAAEFPKHRQRRSSFDS